MAEDPDDGSDEGGDEGKDEANGRRRRAGARPKKRVAYGRGLVFPELLQNAVDRRYTIRIDTRQQRGVG